MRKGLQEFQSPDGSQRSIHSGQRTCAVTVVKEDGQQQPCGEVCKNAKVLADHKRKHKNASLLQSKITKTSALKKFKKIRNDLI